MSWSREEGQQESNKQEKTIPEKVDQPETKSVFTVQLLASFN